MLHRFSPACESTRQRCVHSASSSLRLSNIFVSFVTFCKTSPLIQETDGRKVMTFLFAIQLPAPPSKSAGAPAHSKTRARAPIIFAIAKPLGLRASRQVSRVFFAQRSNAERSLTTHANHIPVFGPVLARWTPAVSILTAYLRPRCPCIRTPTAGFI